MATTNVKGKKLVIVESPTKQKTISKILGSDFIVRSSFGHVRDLPSKDIGVDIDHNFTPTYVAVDRAKKLIKELEPLAKNASEIYLATDPDREGEAIAWHLVELLKIPQDRYQRIFFHEITPSAIKESFSHARKIDLNLVDAQQARRILDRIVGYKLSPLLWKKITSGLSAGRVQSVAVRLLAERAKEIADFKEQEYWTLNAQFEKPGAAPQFWARVLKWEGKNVEQTTTYHLFAEDYKVKTTVFNKPETLAPVTALLRKAPSTVLKVEKKAVKQKPKPPFITSSMQQDAYNKLGFSSQKTMMTAQSLYEGIAISGQTVGLITYMRTDSFNVSKLLQEQTKKFIAAKYGQDFVPAKQPVYKSKVMGAQEAHEAIHPTDVNRTPQAMKPYLTADQYKLYELIWLRFVASQMAEAVFNTVTIDIAGGGDEKQCVLRATGSRPLPTRSNPSPTSSKGTSLRLTRKSKSSRFSTPRANSRRKRSNRPFSTPRTSRRRRYSRPSARASPPARPASSTRSKRRRNRSFRSSPFFPCKSARSSNCEAGMIGGSHTSKASFRRRNFSAAPSASA